MNSVADAPQKHGLGVEGGQVALVPLHVDARNLLFLLYDSQA